jgi:hypothetical protein
MSLRESLPTLFSTLTVRTAPFNPINARSTSIFLRSMYFSLIYYTPMPPFRMKSQAQRPTLRGLSASALCVRRLPRFDRGVKFLLSLRSSHLFQKQSAKQQQLTPFFSIMPFHFFALFFTLAEISPVLATHTKKTRGYPSLRHKMCTIVPIACFSYSLCAARVATWSG